MTKFLGPVAGEGAWVALGQGLSMLGAFLSLRLLTQYLSPTQFAQLGLVLGVSALATGLFITPVAQAASRFYSQSSKRNEVPALRLAVLRSLTKSTFLLAVLLSALGPFAVYFFGWSLWYAPAVVVLVATDVFRVVESTLLSAGRIQRIPAIWSGLDALGRPLFAVALIHTLGASPPSVILAHSFASLASYLGVRLKYYHRFPYSTDQLAIDRDQVDSHLAALTAYAKPLVPVAAVAWLNSLSDRYVIAALLGLSDSGIYMATYGLVSRPFLMLGGLLLQTLRPVYYDAVSRGNHEGARRVSRALLAGMLLSCLAASTLLLALRGFLVDLLLGPAFRSGAHLIPLFVLGYIFLCLSYVRTTVSLAYMHSGAVFWAESAGAMTSLLAGIPLTYAFGLDGAAAAVPMYYAAQLFTAHFQARRHTPTLSGPLNLVPSRGAA